MACFFYGSSSGGSETCPDSAMFGGSNWYFLISNFIISMTFWESVLLHHFNLNEGSKVATIQYNGSLKMCPNQLCKL